MKRQARCTSYFVTDPNDLPGNSFLNKTKAPFRRNGAFIFLEGARQAVSRLPEEL
jgi:hypothetical protein